MDNDNDDDDDTHPPRIIVRVGMVFRRGQKVLSNGRLARYRFFFKIGDLFEKISMYHLAQNKNQNDCLLPLFLISNNIFYININLFCAIQLSFTGRHLKGPVDFMPSRRGAL